MAIIKPNNNTISAITALPAAISTGKVLQVLQTVKTDTETVNSTSFTDISGLNISITPSSTSSKILINLDMTFGSEDDIYPAFKLLRGTTVVTTATDLQGSCISSTFGRNNYYSTNTANIGYSFLDSPSTTSATTYKIQVADADNTIAGQIMYLDEDGTAVTSFPTVAASDTITLNSGTQGGLVGDTFTLIDIATDKYAVSGQMRVSAGANPATPFSAAVS